MERSSEYAQSIERASTLTKRVMASRLSFSALALATLTRTSSRSSPTPASRSHRNATAGRQDLHKSLGVQKNSAERRMFLGEFLRGILFKRPCGQLHATSHGGLDLEKR